MIGFALAGLLAATVSPEAAFFRAWYPEAFADVPAESKPEELLRAAVGLARRGRVGEAKQALADLVVGSDPDWSVVGVLSQARLEHELSRGLDAEILETLESQVVYVQQLAADRDVSALAARLRVLPEERQRQLLATKYLSDTLIFLEEARSKEEFEVTQRGLQDAAAGVPHPEAQLAVALVWARASARGGNDAATVLRQGAQSLSGCARAAVLDAAAHLELGWAGSPLSFGVPLRDARQLAQRLRAGAQIPPLVPPSPAIRPTLDLATEAFATCRAPWVRTERALHVAVLSTRVGAPNAADEWLAVVSAAREAEDERTADAASLLHALLTDNSDVAAARLTAMSLRRDRAAFASAVEVTLLVTDLVLMQGDVLRADVGWGALEAALSKAENSSWDATRALVAQRSAQMAFTNGLHGRAVVDGERAVSAYASAIQQCEAHGARLSEDELSARTFLEGVCGLLKGDAFVTAEALRGAYRQAVARGLIPAVRSIERAAELDRLRAEWRRSIPWAASIRPEPRKGEVTLDRMNDLQRMVQRELWAEGPTCAAWKRIEVAVGKDLRILDDVGVPQVTGLSFQLDARLADCSPAEASRARARLRKASVDRARASLPSGPNVPPSMLVGHVTRAQAVVWHALALGELDVAAQWLDLYTELSTATNAPQAHLPARAWLALARKRPEEALRLLSNAPPLDPSALHARLEARAQQGEGEEALVLFDAMQATNLATAERAAGIDRRNPFSAERAALESEEARRGRLDAPSRARLEELRRTPAFAHRPPVGRFEKRDDVKSWVRTLPAEFTVLAFQYIGSSIIAWRIERDIGVKMVRVALQPAFMDELVALERSTRAGALDATGPAQALWKTILEPLGPIEDDRVVVVAASVELSGLLFEALHAPGERALALRVPVLRAQGLRELHSFAPRKGRPLGFGLAKGGLSHTEEEAASAMKKIGGTVLEPSATRAQVLAAISKASWLHFATHSSLDPSVPLASTITLSSGESLRVYDFLSIAGGVEGIVFSACETNLSGFSALAHAGGARLALSTPWPIWDTEAAAMTDAYYGALGAEPDAWVRRAPGAVLAARRAGAARGMVDESAAASFISSVRSVESLFGTLVPMNTREHP